MSIEELKEAKKALGVKTDKDLAEYLGVKISSINNYRERGIPEKIKAKIYHKALLNSTSQESPRINYYSHVTASAGYGVALYEEKAEKLELVDILMMGLRVANRNNLDILCVSGDSMLPMLHDGDRVLVERNCEYKNGDVVIANIDGDIYVKRVQKDPNNQWIILVSDNLDYGVIKLEGQEVERLNVIAIVRASYRVKAY